MISLGCHVSNPIVQYPEKWPENLGRGSDRSYVRDFPLYNEGLRPKKIRAAEAAESKPYSTTVTVVS